MAIYFIADTHFSHGNIIRYCNRPFSSGQEMDETIYANWTALVQPKDKVYHLGDVAFGSEAMVARTVERIKKLPGVKYLLPGNHDGRYPELVASAFAEVLPPLYELSAQSGREGVRIVLCHYPLLTWNRAFHGALHFHGHVHGRIPYTNRRIDVGVDAWGFAPARLENVIARLKSAPEGINPEQGEEVPDDED